MLRGEPLDSLARGLGTIRAYCPSFASNGV
jgi:hypothetical protein